MSSHLPTLLSVIDFEALPASLCNTTACSEFETPNDSLPSKEHVEELARQYLAGQPLFILTATLRGPFHSSWRNPWISAHRTRTELDTRKRQGVLLDGDKKKRTTKRSRASCPSPRADCSTDSTRENEHVKFLISPSTPPDDILTWNSRRSILHKPISEQYSVKVPITQVSSNIRDTEGEERIVNAKETLDMSIPRFTPVNQRFVDETPFRDNCDITLNPYIPKHAVKAAQANSIGAQSKNQLHNELQSKRKQIIEHAMQELSTSNLPVRTCVECGSVSTCQWRKGPQGPATLCNACGSRYSRRSKKPKAPKASGRVSKKQKISVAGAPNHQEPAAATQSNIPVGVSPPAPSAPRASSSLDQRPLGTKYFSQPDPSQIISHSVEELTKGPSSFPQISSRPKIRRLSIMESMFPGGLLTDAFRRHGQLIDLMQNDATARLSQVLKIDTNVSQSNSVRQASLIKNSRPHRKVRAVTFDTPVVTHLSKSTRSRAHRTSHVPNLDHDIPAIKDRKVASGTSADETTYVANNPELLSNDTPAEVRNPNVPTWKALADSPQISTQAAMVKAHHDFQEALDSPRWPSASTNGSPRSALRDKSNIYANITPVQAFGQFKSTTELKSSQDENSPEINTQALFDAPFSFDFSPAVMTPLPKSDGKKVMKRASFTADSLVLYDPADSPSANSTPLVKGTGPSSLRKSALRNSTTAARVSFVSSSSSNDRAPTQYLSIFALPEQNSSNAAEETSGKEAESFLQDVNSLLQVWGSQ